MKSIVAFSGGLDSIYVLWKELKDTTNDVSAVFFVAPNLPTGFREKYQIRAMPSNDTAMDYIALLPAVADLIRAETRPFELSYVYYDLSKVVDPLTGSNHASVLRVKWAIDRINAGLADRYVVGHCRDNDGGLTGNPQFQTNSTPSSLSMDVFKATATRGEYALPLQDYEYTAANAYAELPASLSNARISCEPLPAEGPCGVCYKCSMHTFTQSQIASGMTPKQIYDYTMSRCNVGPNEWCSERRWLAEEVPTYTTRITENFPTPVFATSYKVPSAE